MLLAALTAVSACRCPPPPAAAHALGGRPAYWLEASRASATDGGGDHGRSPVLGYVVQGLEICLESVALTPQDDITLEM